MSEPTTVSGRRIPDIDIIEDESFTYDGFQVVRGEFFSHIYEPSFTLNLNKISVNMACIRKLPDVEYVQILVHPEEKNLVIRPCKEEEKDSFRWKTTGKKVSPKQVTCKSNGELLFVFNLNNPEIYIRVFREGEKPRVSRTPVYPQEWKNQFGISVEEHRKSLSMNKFNEYTIFGVRETATKGEPDISNRKEDVNNESE